MRQLPLIIGLLLALLLVPAACTPHSSTASEGSARQDGVALAPVALADGGRLRVVATTTIVADVVSNVAGGLADVATLLPVGADPHAFEPTPRDLAMLQGAHVIMANGAGLEQFLERWLATAGEGVPVVYLSDGIPLRRLASAHDASHEAEHQAEAVDPHTWTSPVNVMTFARNAAEALAVLDPAHAEAFRANAEAYIGQLEELDRWVQEQIAAIPEERRLLVTDHDVFGYYADRYGLRQVGAIIPAFSSAAQPSARELADLQATMQELGVKAVFVGMSVNPTLAERVAQDLEIELVTLYTGSLGEPGSGAETYIDYVRYNTRAIVDALR